MLRQTSITTKKSNPFGKIITFTVFYFIIIIMLVAGTLVLYMRNIIEDTSPIAEYDIRALLEENSIIIDRYGLLLEKVNDGGIRSIIPFEAIDPDVVNAFIAVEDKTFFTHNGFNFTRMFGAIIESLREGSTPSGTSTITQQYARNMYLRETRFKKGSEGYIRKIKEAFYTRDLEAKLTKEDILYSYLNTIDLGANVQGIQAASERYFSKEASDLDYVEAGILAGIPKASSKYSPFTIVYHTEVTEDMLVLGEHSDDYLIVFNQAMVDRFKTVMYAMYENGYISEGQLVYALNFADLGGLVDKLNPSTFRNQTVTGYFTDMVKTEVLEALQDDLNLTYEEAEDMLYGGGLVIHSTMDTTIQQTIEEAYRPTYNSLFTPEMYKAVIAFQKEKNLDVDGVIGPQTLNLLKDLGYNTGDLSKSTYVVWENHDDIKILKAMLEAEGVLLNTHEFLPVIEAYRNRQGHILNVFKDDNDRVVGSKIQLLDKASILTEDQALKVPEGSYSFNDEGDLVLNKDKMFNFYRISNEDGEQVDLAIYLKDTYVSQASDETKLLGPHTYYYEKVSIKQMSIYKGKTLKVPYEFKSFSANRNLIIDREFLENTQDFYSLDQDKNLLINTAYYDIADQGVIQPQSAMVVIDYTSGELLAMLGGRNISGQKVYNRALNPRQPGSAIKPLSVYTPALATGLTVAHVFDDVPHYDYQGKRWPKNWYDHQAFKYWGIMSMRQALEMSNNVIAVKIAEQLGIDTLIPYLEAFGISTLDFEGDVNDYSSAALALGGMSVGVTPLELTSGFGAIANGGLRQETITFTKITDKAGNLILTNTSQATRVVSDQVAFLMHDMMESGSRVGLAKTAAIYPGNENIPIAGKTGTTTNKNDAWFIGYTPYYVTGVWMGNDIQVSLSQGSTVAAKFWKMAMEKVYEGYEAKSFNTAEDLDLITVEVDRVSGKLPNALSLKDPEGPSLVNEIFIPGTEPTTTDDVHREVVICSTSRKPITPFCPVENHISVVYRTRLDADYNPFKNLKYGEKPYAIRDGAYTVPRASVALAAVTDYLQFTDDATAPYCYIHTGASRTASSTATKFLGVALLSKENGEISFEQDIQILTTYGATIAVEKGSVINTAGNIITLSGNVVYPWQIVSFTGS